MRKRKRKPRAERRAAQREQQSRAGELLAGYAQAAVARMMEDDRRWFEMMVRGVAERTRGEGTSPALPAPVPAKPDTDR